MAAQTLPSSQKPGVDLPSPTLTNPDMILPNGHGEHSQSINLASLPDGDIPPSAPQMRLRAAPKSSQAQEHRRQRLSREISRDSDAETRPGNAHKRLGAKASAQALKTQDSFEIAKKRMSLERTWSDGSAESVNSDVLERMRWPSTHGPDGINGEDLEDDEYDEQGFAEFIDRNPKPIAEDDEIEEEQSGNDEDPYSSMGRRAELILANAKKRLNLMEGNLRGARTSLRSPTPYTFDQSSADSTANPASAKSCATRGGRIHSSLGFSSTQNSGTPTRTSSVLYTRNSGHSRNFSEPHAPVRSLSLSNRAAGRDPQSFATGRAGGNPPFLQSRSLRGTRSSDVLGDSRSLHHPLRKPSLDWSSPTNLDTLPEDESTSRSNGETHKSDQGLQSSSSATNELRTQMHLLKGRLSNLRERTIEDNLRRRNMQSARIPSPFTDAEAWYTGAETYSGHSVNTEAGVGYSPTERLGEDGSQNSLRQPAALDPSLDEGSTPDPRYSNPYSSLPIDPRLRGRSEQLQSNIDVKAKELRSNTRTPRDEVGPYTPSITGESTYEDAEEKIEDRGGQSTPTATDEKFQTSYFDDYDEDAKEPQTATRGTFNVREDESMSERHEDRADAFDYEHFFLHSSMGSMSRSRSNSRSSNESVETTRGLPAKSQSEPETSGGALETPQDQRHGESRVWHGRRESASSVSTMATFATATEGNNTPADEREEDDVLPMMTNDLQISSNYPANNGILSIPVPWSQGRPDSGVGIQTRAGGSQHSPPISSSPHGQSDPSLSAYASNQDISASNTSLGSSRKRSRSSSKPWVSPIITPVVASLLSSTRPAIKLERSDETNLKILLESLREVCLRLCEEEDENERQEWSRRLLEARRVLDGRSRPQHQALY